MKARFKFYKTLPKQQIIASLAARGFKYKYATYKGSWVFTDFHWRD